MKEMKIKLKEFFLRQREGEKWRRWLVLVIMNIGFYAAMSIPCFLPLDEGAVGIMRIVVFVIFLCRGFVWGFISEEMTGGVLIGNLIPALFGGLYGAAIASGFLGIYVGQPFLLSFVSHAFYFLRYSLAGFFVSLIIKNTK